jgi:hypothetical protein
LVTGIRFHRRRVTTSERFRVCVTVEYLNLAPLLHLFTTSRTLYRLLLHVKTQPPLTSIVSPRERLPEIRQCSLFRLLRRLLKCSLFRLLRRLLRSALGASGPHRGHFQDLHPLARGSSDLPIICGPHHCSSNQFCDLPRIASAHIIDSRGQSSQRCMLCILDPGITSSKKKKCSSAMPLNEVRTLVLSAVSRTRAFE